MDCEVCAKAFPGSMYCHHVNVKIRVNDFLLTQHYTEIPLEWACDWIKSNYKKVEELIIISVSDKVTEYRMDNTRFRIEVWHEN